MTAENQHKLIPNNSWRMLGLVAVLLLVLTVTAIGFISAGFFDPKPVGELTAELALESQTIPAQSQQIQWLEDDLTAENFSLLLTAAYESGEMDIGYGLAVGSSETAVVIGLSPLGYAGVTLINPLPLQPAGEEMGTADDLDNMIANSPNQIGNGQLLVWPGLSQTDSERSLFDWQPWPHVKGGGETNEIWLDKQGQTFTVRINREYLWSSALTLSTPQIGLYTATFNQPATIAFQSLAIYSE